MMHSGDDALEIEVKFHLADPDAARQRLLALGAVVQAKVFETNQRFEDRDNQLVRQGRLLRLRRDNSCRLTYKSRPAQQDNQFKVYRELEVTVDDCDTLRAILLSLGFKVVQIYEKWRETFSLSDTWVCIDTMPYGMFMEIEGTKTKIQKTVEQLGLPWQQRILRNYLAIFEILRQKMNLPFNDVTFANFQQYPVDLVPYLDLLYADKQA